MIKRVIAVICSVILISSCGVKTGKETTAVKHTENSAELTLEEKVGQLFIVQCVNGDMSAILEKQPGGILMFSYNFDDLSKDEVIAKIDGFRAALKVEPYIAVDEEGGTVVRVSNHSALAPEAYKSPQYYYGIGGMPAIIDNTIEKSELLSSLGINMNLAPVADVSTDENDFIYARSLGQDAETTADYVSAVVRAMSNHNVSSCLKHFPGYGNNTDTHTGIAIDNRPLSEFYEKDLLPFRSGIDAGADAVLVSHNIITAADPDQPASISPEIHRILRDELGFEGLIITDDMSMGAMAEYDTPYIKAVLAGNDMIIVSDINSAYNEVLGAVKDGTIPMDVLDNAVERILESKRR